MLVCLFFITTLKFPLQTVECTVHNLLLVVEHFLNCYFLQATGIKEEHYIIICGNPPPEIAFAVINLILKFTMHIAAVVLAIRTRHVQVKVINDTKETQAIVYISTVLLVLFVVCNFIFEGYPNIYGLTVGVFAYIETVMFLGLTFIPKVLLYCCDLFL